MTTALIDADILVYRAGFAVQRNNYIFRQNEGGDIDLQTSKRKEMITKLKELSLTRGTGKVKKQIIIEPLAHACQITKRMLLNIAKRCDVDKMELYLTSTDHSNFRFELAKTRPYKGNRTQPKPYHYDAIRKYLITYWNAEVVYNIEADDMIGIRSRLADKPLICSIDKDLDMLPGMHYNFVTDEVYKIADPGFLFLSENKKSLKGGGLLWFYAQILLGDSADNIPGLAGWGPVTTYNALKDCKKEGVMIEIVKDLYLKEYGTKDKAEAVLMEMVDLLWIWRQDGKLKSAEWGPWT